MNQMPNEQFHQYTPYVSGNEMSPQPPSAKYVEGIMELYGSSLFFKRWGATIVDSVFLGGLSATLFLLNESYLIIGIVVLAVVFLSYYFLLESLTGYTVGKYLFRIRAVNEEGYAPGMGKGFLRALLRIVDTNPLLFGSLPAGICVLATKKKQRLGDMATNTFVASTKDLQSKSSRFSGLWLSVVIIALFTSIVLIVVAIVSIATGKGGIFGSDEPEVFQSFNSEFQVTANESWSKMDDLHDEADITIGNIFSEKYLIVFNESKLDFDPYFTLEDYTQLVDDSFRGAYADAQVTDYKAVTIGGSPGYQLEFEDVADGTEITYIVTSVETGDHFHQIIAWSLSSKIDLRREELLEVVSTFQPVQ
ncbi:RDD family protein [Paenibacillus sp. GSMTC-2017]|uniref:RDD family protein n=1 Tax=Paenibacillus sp. GSMTC-2017 TaxID=2794350 RepID=UPI0018D913D9|nr:RDD family protein [Paenibacillus sp. GSMTC-2017]MBH5318623.1 RDD family protein [Paenibacillus sp. GSMTC-2017]